MVNKILFYYHIRFCINIDSKMPYCYMQYLMNTLILHKYFQGNLY